MSKKEKNTKPQQIQPPSTGDSFDYKMDLLKIEIDIIERSIDRIDNMSKSTRHLAIIVWAGSIAVSLGQPELRKYIIVSSITPLLFWLVDSWWAYLRRRHIIRRKKISDFLNSDRLNQSFKERELIDFKILDLTISEIRSKQSFLDKLKIFLLKVIWYPELFGFYLGLSFISIFLGIYFNG